MDLEEGLNITKMQRIYKEYMKTSLVLNLATERQYHEFFNSEVNVSFFKPEKDQCLFCTVYKDANQNAKSNLQEQFEKQLASKKAVRSLKDNDKR
nr:unnamed protein product [Callosobruchus analis]